MDHILTWGLARCVRQLCPQGVPLRKWVAVMKCPPCKVQVAQSYHRDISEALNLLILLRHNPPLGWCWMVVEEYWHGLVAPRSRLLKDAVMLTWNTIQMISWLDWSHMTFFNARLQPRALGTPGQHCAGCQLWKQGANIMHEQKSTVFSLRLLSKSPVEDHCARQTPIGISRCTKTASCVGVRVQTSGRTVIPSFACCNCTLEEPSWYCILPRRDLLEMV